MQNLKRVVISAAGVGSRLGLNMPKCLVEVGGKKLIEHQLNLLSDFDEVWVVVGFKASSVIDAVLKIREDAIFVFNHRFSETSNSESLYLASRVMKSGFLAIDGDLLIEPNSFIEFNALIHQDEILVGYSDATTEEAVYIDIDKSDRDRMCVLSFVNSSNSDSYMPLKYEWSGVCYFPNPQLIQRDAGYVYKQIENHPSERYAAYIKVAEIDTPNDLVLAERKFVEWGLS